MRRPILHFSGLLLILSVACAGPEQIPIAVWSAVPNTVPEVPSFARAAMPTWMGAESSIEQAGSPYAHKWTDSDARTALWYTRNFPDDTASLLFAFHKLLSYNNRDDRVRSYTRPASDMGYFSSGVLHTRTDEVIALMWDPQLKVKMLSLEARERTRMRERDRRRDTATWPYDVTSQPRLDTDDLSDREIEQRLLDRYQ